LRFRVEELSKRIISFLRTNNRRPFKFKKILEKYFRKHLHVANKRKARKGIERGNVGG